MKKDYPAVDLVKKDASFESVNMTSLSGLKPETLARKDRRTRQRIREYAEKEKKVVRSYRRAHALACAQAGAGARGPNKKVDVLDPEIGRAHV